MAAQLMMERLEGFQIRFNVIQQKAQKDSTHIHTPDQRKDGYKYIRDERPSANNMNDFMEWADDKDNDESTPIHGWQEARVITP